jgi:hypothetical protein
MAKVEKYEAVDKKSLKDIIWHNFLGGISWGLGATIGLSIVLTIVGFILRNVDVIPVIGDFVYKVTEYMETTNTKVDPDIDR